MHTHTRTHIHIHTYKHRSTHTHAHAHAHTHTHTHKHTHIHTHTRTHASHNTTHLPPIQCARNPRDDTAPHGPPLCCHPRSEMLESRRGSGQNIPYQAVALRLTACVLSRPQSRCPRHSLCAACRKRPLPSPRSLPTAARLPDPQQRHRGVPLAPCDMKHRGAQGALSALQVATPPRTRGGPRRTLPQAAANPWISSFQYLTIEPQA